MVTVTRTDSKRNSRYYKQGTPTEMKDFKLHNDSLLMRGLCYEEIQAKNYTLNKSPKFLIPSAVDYKNLALK